MKERQRLIHEERNGLKHEAPPIGNEVTDKKKLAGFGLKIKNFVAAHKGLFTLSVALVLWSTVGEVILAHPYRITTFMGLRMGRTVSEEIKTALPAEATKQEVISAAAGTVELKKNCQNLRNQLGQQAFAQCVATGGTMPVCEYKLEQAQSQPCEEFSAETLVKHYQQKTNQGETP